MKVMITFKCKKCRTEMRRSLQEGTPFHGPNYTGRMRTKKDGSTVHGCSHIFMVEKIELIED